MHPMGHQSPVVPTLQTMPEILHRDAIITSTQSHIQSQLQRKHEELQKLIMKQQEELQLVSEQLHLAQHGMLTQMESQFSNRHPIRMHSHPNPYPHPHPHQHQIDNMTNNTIVHRTVLRLMENSSLINNGSNEQQTVYMEQPVNQAAICHTTDVPSNTSASSAPLGGKPNLVEQLPQVHSSQDFHASKVLTNDSNQANMSPASISSTIGAIKYTSTSD